MFLAINKDHGYRDSTNPLRGHISYNAPSGFHDDCVMALALANHRRWETESCGPMMPLAPRTRFLPFANRARFLLG